MAMNCYSEYTRVPSDKDFQVVRFDNGLLAAIIDQYCTNPDCQCVTVNLEFREVDEKGNLLEKLFSFNLDTVTWKTSGIKKRISTIDCNLLIDEFTANLDPTLKERYKTRLKKAKESGNNEVLNWFDDRDFDKGICLSYAQVYGENFNDNRYLFFEFKDREYFVDDQYCINPNCQCNEVILSFIDIIPDKEKQEVQFVLRVPFVSGNYELKYSGSITEEEIKQVFDHFKEHTNDELGLLKRRYAKMKEFGKERNERKKQKELPKIAGITVGRNDPCPCGSGKKYKKCCGKSAG